MLAVGGAEEELEDPLTTDGFAELLDPELTLWLVLLPFDAPETVRTS